MHQSPNNLYLSVSWAEPTLIPVMFGFSFKSIILNSNNMCSVKLTKGMFNVTFENKNLSRKSIAATNNVFKLKVEITLVIINMTWNQKKSHT